MIFHNRPNWVYVYYAVPPLVWVDFIKADSHGKFFSNNIRDVFRYRKFINGNNINGKTKRN